MFSVKYHAMWVAVLISICGCEYCSHRATEVYSGKNKNESLGVVLIYWGACHLCNFICMNTN